MLRAALPAAVAGAGGDGPARRRLEAARWADLDETGGRLRISAATSKTGRARFAPLPADLLAAIAQLVPREDRHLDAPIFPEASQERMRTDLGRACRRPGWRASGSTTCATAGSVAASTMACRSNEVARAAGHARASVTLDTYAHVLVNDREVNRPTLLG